MCLGIPGEVIAIDDDSPAMMTMGTVAFGGVRQQVCLACVPEAVVGDYVLVHVGFAISRIDEAEAREVFKLLEEIEALAETEDLSELELPQPRS
jgi:hydrogenase expression/formation protein HypC